MFKSILGTVYPSIPIEFESPFSIAESVKKLKILVKRNMLIGLIKETSFGSVAEDDVTIQRLLGPTGFRRPYFAVFYGRFEEDDGKVFLRGKYSPSIFSRVFMTVWFMGVLAFIIVAVIDTISEFTENTLKPYGLLFPFVGAAFAVVGFYSLRVSWWFARGDMVFISNLIRSAFSEGLESS